MRAYTLSFGNVRFVASDADCFSSFYKKRRNGVFLAIAVLVSKKFRFSRLSRVAEGHPRRGREA
jgi:hypothetical protein